MIGNSLSLNVVEGIGGRQLYAIALHLVSFKAIGFCYKLICVAC